MLAPRLRHRLAIQRQTQTQDIARGGAITVLWTDLDTEVPCEAVPLSGREFIQANAVQVQVDTRFTIRWRDDLDETMRLVFDGSIYNIRSILPDPSARRWLTVLTIRSEPVAEAGETILDGGQAGIEPGGVVDGGGA